MSFCAVVMGSRKGVFCTTRRFDPGSTTFATTYDENPAQLSEIRTPTDELGLTPSSRAIWVPGLLLRSQFSTAWRLKASS